MPTNDRLTEDTYGPLLAAARRALHAWLAAVLAEIDGPDCRGFARLTVGELADAIIDKWPTAGPPDAGTLTCPVHGYQGYSPACAECARDAAAPHHHSEDGPLGCPRCDLARQFPFAAAAEVEATLNPDLPQEVRLLLHDNDDLNVTLTPGAEYELITRGDGLPGPVNRGWRVGYVGRGPTGAFRFAGPNDQVLYLGAEDFVDARQAPRPIAKNLRYARRKTNARRFTRAAAGGTDG